jgi:hypothetical protein
MQKQSNLNKNIEDNDNSNWPTIHYLTQPQFKRIL